MVFITNNFTRYDSDGLTFYRYLNWCDMSMCVKYNEKCINGIIFITNPTYVITLENVNLKRNNFINNKEQYCVTSIKNDCSTVYFY